MTIVPYAELQKKLLELREVHRVHCPRFKAGPGPCRYCELIDAELVYLEELKGPGLVVVNLPDARLYILRFQQTFCSCGRDVTPDQAPTTQQAELGEAWVLCPCGRQSTLPVVRWIGARPGRELHPAGVAAALAAIDAEDLQNVDYDAVRLILDRRPAPATVSTTIGGNPALIAAELLEAAGAEVVQQTVEDLAAQLEEPIEVPEWIAALSPAEAKAAADDLRQQLSNGWIENDGKLGDQLDYLEKRASEAQ